MRAGGACGAAGCQLRAAAARVSAHVIPVKRDADERGGIQRGAVEHVVSSMRACDRHEGVQAQGCWALANLATNSDTNSRIIFESKGIDVIISAMRLFPDL